jgi:DNA gyrase subunit A
MGVLDIMAYYLDYQKYVVKKRTEFDLAAAKEREHIVTGLLIAIKNIDEVIKIIKKSPNVTAARQTLRERFTLSEKQAQAILDMRLARLTHLEIEKLEEELRELEDLIATLSAILKDKKLLVKLIRDELWEIRMKYKTPRLSAVVNDTKEVVVPVIDNRKPYWDGLIATFADGELKRVSQRSFSMSDKKAEKLKDMLTNACFVDNEAKIGAFTDRGNCVRIT